VLSVTGTRESNGKGVSLTLSDGADTPPHAASSRSSWTLLAASICIGLAVGSKFAAIMLFLPLLVTVYLAKSKAREWIMIGLVGIAGAVFVLTNPFAILDFTCELITPAIDIGPIHVPALDWRSCFLDNISTQSAMARGAIDLPFTRQYQGTLPFLYYFEMQLRWGMGILLGLVAFSGFGWITWRAIKALRVRDWRLGLKQTTRHIRPATLILLSWSLPFFIATGSFYVKFMRYLQPVTPFLILFGAAMLCRWRHVAWRRFTIVTVLLLTGLYALSFVNLSQQPHPWTAASRWVYANITPGALILSEQWDDALPVSMVIDGEQRRRSEYENEQLTWLAGTRDRDDSDKLDANLELLARAEYVTLASNRVYGVVPRLPDRYPISSQYHQLLLDGSLGYETVAIFGRFPGFFGFHLIPDTFSWPGLRPPDQVVAYLSNVRGVNWGRADESFTVYDQPLTIIFQNVRDKTSAEMRQMFELD
jgi:cytochrome c oxidase subunit IV